MRANSTTQSNLTQRLGLACDSLFVLLNLFFFKNNVRQTFYFIFTFFKETVKKEGKGSYIG